MDAAEKCVQIKYQCLPYALTMLSTGFMEAFLLALILMKVQTVEGPNNRPESWQDTTFTVVVVLLLYFGLNLLFLGLEDVANQLEDPTPALPLREICESTQRDVMRLPGAMHALQRAEEARRRAKDKAVDEQREKEEEEMKTM
jgi:hypothetical protein